MNKYDLYSLYIDSKIQTLYENTILDIDFLMEKGLIKNAFGKLEEQMMKLSILLTATDNELLRTKKNLKQGRLELMKELHAGYNTVDVNCPEVLNGFEYYKNYIINLDKLSRDFLSKDPKKITTRDIAIFDKNAEMLYNNYIKDTNKNFEILRDVPIRQVIKGIDKSISNLSDIKLNKMMWQYKILIRDLKKVIINSMDDNNTKKYVNHVSTITRDMAFKATRLCPKITSVFKKHRLMMKF